MNRKIFWIGLGVLFIVALGAALSSVLAGPPSFRGMSYAEPYPQAFDFELTRANGETFRMSDQRGKIVLLFFGFTNCTDVCPTTLAQLKQMYVEISKPEAVKVVLITVDPQRDTLKITQDYVNHFDPSFIGLSGAQVKLESIWKNYGVFREIAPGSAPTNYEVNHTARITLIDQNGTLRLSYGTPISTNDMLHDIEILLK